MLLVDGAALAEEVAEIMTILRHLTHLARSHARRSEDRRIAPPHKVPILVPDSGLVQGLVVRQDTLLVITWAVDPKGPDRSGSSTQHPARPTTVEDRRGSEEVVVVAEAELVLPGKALQALRCRAAAATTIRLDLAGHAGDSRWQISVAKTA